VKTKIKAIVEYFHRSIVAAAKLNSVQLQMCPHKAALKLKNDVITCWNLFYHMVSHLCEVQEPLEATIALLHNPVDEWVALKEAASSIKTVRLCHDGSQC